VRSSSRRGVLRPSLPRERHRACAVPLSAR
jgi:hypothetical protein